MKVLAWLSAAFLIAGVVLVLVAVNNAADTARQAEPQIQQAIQQLSSAQTALQQLSTLTQPTAPQPAEGSACTPAGGGKGVIVIEGPTAANPGHADCVPQLP